MTDLAPIILFVYNRPWHTRQTLEALAKNDLATESELFIYADGPKEDATEEELNKILAVRQLIREKSWCGKVHISERDKNMGVANSVITGISEIVNRFGKIIVLEDDIVTAKGFLKFMNDGLDIYQNTENVRGISGYTYYISKYISESYFLPIGSSWGWATWENSWRNTEWDPEKLKGYIDQRQLQKKVDFDTYPYYQMLIAQCNKKIDSWAIRCHSSMVLESSIFLFPYISLTKNIGFDETGTHTHGLNPFAKKRFKTNNFVDFKSYIEPKLNDDIVSHIELLFRNDFDTSFYYRIRRKLKMI